MSWSTVTSSGLSPWSTSGSNIYKSGGNVGINTSTPQYKLDVNGDINMSTGSSLRINGVAQSFGGGGSSVWLLSSTNAYYNSGNVGIGTTSPAYKLDVDGDINMSTGSSFRINGVAQSFGGGGSSSLSGTNTFEWGTGVSGKETNAGKIGYSTFSTGTNDALDIIGAGTSTSNRAVRIYDKLGIGTSSPGYSLHVHGNMYLTNALYVGSSVASSGTSGQVLTSSGGGAMSWTTVSGGTSQWVYDSTVSPPELTFDSANYGELVGIGTSPHPNYILTVAGSVLIDSSMGSNGDLSVYGSLSKGSGSFKIDHPLPSMSNTHCLYHSFIEGPQADLIYRGKVDLVNGSASINLDTVSKMTSGTFEVLNRNVQCFTSNESDWDAVKGSVSGKTLTISCQNASSTANVSWLVIGERKDKHMYDTGWTDDDGFVIPEQLK
jgi:hypothetical protein